MIVASMLAAHLHLPLGEINSWLGDGALFPATGRLVMNPKFQRAVDTSAPLLVMDDSVHQGVTLEPIKARLKASDELLFGAMYVTPGSEDKIDFYHSPVTKPRFFEWNLMNHYQLCHSFVDIDGVLCRDPYEEEKDWKTGNGKLYKKFLETVPALYKPSYYIHTVCTGRPVFYRRETKGWLHRNGIHYKELRMFPETSLEKYKDSGKKRYRWKGAVYKKSPCKYFIESSPHEAKVIAKTSGKSVICLGDKRVY